LVAVLELCNTNLWETNLVETATAMIIISDNTATNIHCPLGRRAAALESAVQGWGHSSDNPATYRQI